MATGFRNLTVYKKAFALAMDIYYVSKKFLKDEFYSLTTQIRKSTEIWLALAFKLPTADQRLKTGNSMYNEDILGILNLRH